MRGELLQRLEASGLRVCIDFRDFQAGLPILVNIERSAENSRKTLLVLTPTYVKKNWTRFEQLMLQTDDPSNLNLGFIPLMRETCELPKRLAMLTHLDFVDPEDLELSWKQLLTALGKPPVANPPEEQTPRQWFLAHPYAMPPHFTGRQSERQMLTQWLTADTKHPLLVIRALGGFGKSALTWHWLTPRCKPHPMAKGGLVELLRGSGQISAAFCPAYSNI